MVINKFKQPCRGVFWDMDGVLLAFPFVENMFDAGLAKSGNTYVHKKLWREVKPKKCHKPYNYYPRGRIEITSNGKGILYMNPNVSEYLIPKIMKVFGLAEMPKIVYDNSQHYKCYLDERWKEDV